MGPDQDPLIFGRLRIFRMWYDLLPTVLQLSERPLALAWEKAWKHMLAVNACLQHLGWRAPEPWEWISPDELRFDLRD
eukprot:9301456-Pyramimonas_sp.AAC.1